LAAPQILGIVRAQQLGVVGGVWYEQLLWCNNAGIDHALAQQRILAHGEAVAFRERQHEMIGVEDSHQSIVICTNASVASG
jgi:hypothetical protein